MTLKKTRQRLSALGVLCAALLCAPAYAASSAAATCEVDKPVRFSGLNWESNLLMVNVERFILEKGYGCKTQVEQGETMTMLAALQRGDVDVTAEVWPGQIVEAWAKALESGRVEGVGHVFDASEGWYIPRYTAERYPELKSAADLARYQDKFTDPEDPTRGRIFGCPAGWSCGVLNDNLIRALGLDKQFNMFAPGAGAAQKAAILSAYKRKRDIVFYYWTPTALVGSLDLVKLELPPFNQEAYDCLTSPNCANPVATQFKDNKAITGLNKTFSAAAPELRAFFEKVHMPSAVIDSTLGWIETEGKDVEEAATYFLKTHPEVWKTWVPDEVAQRVQKAL